MTDQTETQPTDWIDGHPQLEAIAAAVWEQCRTEGTSLVVDDPRNIAVAALAAVLPAPADRATVLREAADIAEDVAIRLRSEHDIGGATGAYEVMSELRRMADETQQPEADGDVFELPGPEVVAYRNPDRPSVLLCREHGDGWWGLTPLTSDDLPDGGPCIYGDPADPDDVCGVDVLIPQQPKGATS